MSELLTPQEFATMPLDKSYYNMRVGVKSLVEGEEQLAADVINQEEHPVSDDILRLSTAIRNFHTDQNVDVGESGTLLRFLRFYSWKFGYPREFIMHGTLPERPITNDPSIVSWSQEKLQTLDKKTSQWASASALCGDPERLADAPFKLALTYDVIEAWERNDPTLFDRHLDQTIINQTAAFKQMIHGEQAAFIPDQPEDFLFAVAFGFMTFEEGVRSWSSLAGHESNRPVEYVETMRQIQSGEPVTSRDHRMVQMTGMWCVLNEVAVEIVYPEVVSKSWPMYWDCLDLLSQ